MGTKLKTIHIDDVVAFVISLNGNSGHGETRELAAAILDRFSEVTVDVEEGPSEIEILSEKAAKAHSASEALHFSQAALNLASANYTTLQAARSIRPDYEATVFGRDDRRNTN